MPSIDDLDAAGSRAAHRPVPQAPSIDMLSAEVAKRRVRKRRVVRTSVVGLALVVGVPVAASQIGSDDAPPSLLTSAQEGALDPAVVEEPSTTTLPQTDPVDPPLVEAAEPDVMKSGFGFFMDGDHDFSIELGDLSFSVQTIEGAAAAEAAVTAEANADETRDIEGVTVWIDNVTEEQTTVSALVEPDVFVEVTGPAASITSLLELATQEWPDVAFGPLLDLEQFFPDGEVPPFDFEQMFPNGELPPMLDLDEFFANPDATMPEGFGLPPLEELLPPGFLDELERLESEPWDPQDGTPFEGMFEGMLDGTPFESFEGCLDMMVEETDAGVSIEIPDCELFDSLHVVPDPAVDSQDTAVNA